MKWHLIKNYIQDESGSTLILTLFLLLFFSIVGMTMIAVWNQSILSAKSLDQDVQTHYALESGVSDVLSYLDANITGKGANIFATQGNPAPNNTNTDTINISVAPYTNSPYTWLINFENYLKNIQTGGKYTVQIVSKPTLSPALDTATASQSLAPYVIQVQSHQKKVNLNIQFYEYIPTVGGDPFPFTGSEVYSYNQINNNTKQSDIINVADSEDSATKSKTNSTISQIITTAIQNMQSAIASFQTTHPGATIEDNYSVSSNTTVNGSLIVNNGLTLNNDSTLIVQGDCLINGNITSGGTLIVMGNLYTTGDINCTSVNAGGSIYCGGNLNSSYINSSDYCDLPFSIKDYSSNQNLVVNGVFQPSESDNSDKNPIVIGGSLLTTSNIEPSLHGNSQICHVYGDVLSDGTIDIKSNNNGVGHYQYQIDGHLATVSTLILDATLEVGNKNTPINGGSGGSTPILTINQISY